jgi:hypothetical protein
VPTPGIGMLGLSSASRSRFRQWSGWRSWTARPQQTRTGRTSTRNLPPRQGPSR